MSFKNPGRENSFGKRGQKLPNDREKGAKPKQKSRNQKAEIKPVLRRPIRAMLHPAVRKEQAGKKRPWPAEHDRRMARAFARTEGLPQENTRNSKGAAWSFLTVSTTGGSAPEVRTDSSDGTDRVH